MSDEINPINGGVGWSDRELNHVVGGAIFQHVDARNEVIDEQASTLPAIPKIELMFLFSQTTQQ
jgi:hypothetical protein